MIIHYDTTTGQVMSYGWGSDHGDGFETSHLPGCKVLVVDNQPIDARTQRVDPVALAIVARMSRIRCRIGSQRYAIWFAPN